MRPDRRLLGWGLGSLLGLAGVLPAAAQMPPAPPPAPPPVGSPWGFAPMSLRPLPVQPIPDDPPPHEGALYEIPLTIQPPDILVVEALEALPGRNIAGEHLVRPDGTISLGFYGDVHVRGLTLPQAKVKIILHLRRHLGDATLGLYQIMDGALDPGEGPGPIPATKPPTEEPPAADVPRREEPGRGALPPPPDRKATDPARPSARAGGRPAPSLIRWRPVAAQDLPPAPAPRQQPVEGGEDDIGAALQRKPIQIPQDTGLMGGVVRLIHPADSNRLFVELTSHNSRVYFVQGDVGSPGRIPFVGNETVLDALNYAGGLTSQAEPTDVHLYRPARGGAPARDYRIDHAAILRGDSRANLQLFPNDRLVIGRNPVVARTIQLDRALAPFNSILNTAFQTAITLRAIGQAGGDINGNDQAARAALLRRYFDLIQNQPNGRADGFDPRPLLDAPPLPTGPKPTPRANP